MDFSASMLTAKSQSAVFGAGIETPVIVLAVMVVLRLEWQRRRGDVANSGNQSGGFANCKKIMRECAPEAFSIIAFLALAVVLRLCRRDPPVDGNDAESWAQIKAEWPLLMTADTLLAVQAMLRLAVLLSVVLRARDSVPLSGETSWLFLGAGMARAALLTRTSAYMLDGPVGGLIPAACEIAALPLLAALGRDADRRARLAIVVLAGAATWVASHNYLLLADVWIDDALFALAHNFDLLAALSYLLRTIFLGDGLTSGLCDTSVWFVHMVMPLQQGLSAYYFLQVFNHEPQMVGAGHPFEFLKIGNTAMLGAYLGAAGLATAEYFESGNERAQQATVL